MARHTPFFVRKGFLSVKLPHNKSFPYLTNLNSCDILYADVWKILVSRMLKRPAVLHGTGLTEMEYER